MSTDAVREGSGVANGHTPGPWEIGHRGRNVNLIAQPSRTEDKYVAQVYGIPQNTTLEELEGDPRWATGIANARLIAAAPDLLAFAERVASDVMAPLVYQDAAKDAIAKARGQFPTTPHDSPRQRSNSVSPRDFFRIATEVKDG